MITETGQIVQLNVEEEHKPGPRLVQIQLQLMVVQIVLGRRLKLRTVTNMNAQVFLNEQNIFLNDLHLFGKFLIVFAVPCYIGICDIAPH